MVRQRNELWMWQRIVMVDSCWEWIGTTHKEGYGAIRVGGHGSKWVGAHRVMYELFRGKIPDGLTIDHLCRNTRCVNPDHLEAVTMRVNVLRGFSPWAKNARKTHCLRGHELLGENLYLNPAGSRVCRTCVAANGRATVAAHPERVRENQRRYRAAHKAEISERNKLRWAARKLLTT